MMEETKTNYDVIIIGAGPAGLACAKGLIGSGLSVLILEQKDIIGPKICAGGLTRKDLKHIRIPAELMDREFKRFYLHTPLAGTIADDPEVMIATIDRKKFADWQLGELSGAANVEIRTGCKVTAIDDGKVTVGDTASYGYGCLVGADGSFSRVRNFLGLKSEKVAIAVQYIIPTDRYEKMEYYLDAKLFKSWYAWIFPHDGYASVGCMCDPRYLSAKTMQRNFDGWLRKNGIDVSGLKQQGYGINYDYRGYKFSSGKIFLAGDAAGLASGLTGEGIYQAIVSGEEVARSILDSSYESPMIAALLRTKELHETAIRSVLTAGPFGNIFFALLTELVKNKRMAHRLLRYVD